MQGVGTTNGNGNDARYILYVNISYENSHEHCRGSAACLPLVQSRTDVLVQDVHTILTSGVELPSWLDATPTCVDTATGIARRGSGAIEFLTALKESAKAPPRGADPFLSSNYSAQSDMGGSDETSDRDLPKITEDLVEKIMRERKRDTALDPSSMPVMDPPVSAK